MPPSSAPGTTVTAAAVTHFAGRAGDHNNRAMIASPVLADALATRLDTVATVIGTPESALAANWDQELAAALPALQQMSAQFDQILTQGRVPVTALSRCAVALATLPVIADHRPDAVIVWFDAHADINTPDNTTTGYLGGLALSGPLGLWESGLGSGVLTHNVVLVGARDLDDPEQRLVAAGTIALVPVGPDIASTLRRVIAGRPVYVHIDCDVLDAGVVPTDYLMPDGLSLDQLHACAQALAESEIVGVEIGELEAEDDQHATPQPANLVLDAISPLLQKIKPPA